MALLIYGWQKETSTSRTEDMDDSEIIRTGIGMSKGAHSND